MDQTNISETHDRQHHEQSHHEISVIDISANVASERSVDDESCYHHKHIEMGEKHHSWSAFAFILFLLGGLVGAWVIVFHGAAAPARTSTDGLSLVYDPPTAEECAAISRGEALTGQDNMISKLLDVAVDISVNDDSENLDIPAMITSLEAVMRERLVPALSNCPYTSYDSTQKLLRASTAAHESFGAENPKKYAIANTLLELQDQPGISCSAQSPKPCYSVVLKLQLYLKGPEDDSTVMDMIYELGKERPLVDTLGLGAPYAAINFVDITPGLATEFHIYNPPSKQDCDDISHGLNIEGQENMLLERLDVQVDVRLLDDSDDWNQLANRLPILEEAMKERLVLALSHCPFQGSDGLQLLLGSSSGNPNYVVANTFLQLQDRPDLPCLEGSGTNCRRIVMKLELFLKGRASIAALTDLLLDFRKEGPIVETLGLGFPFDEINFVDIGPGTPTDTSTFTTSATTTTNP